MPQVYTEKRISGDAIKQQTKTAFEAYRENPTIEKRNAIAQLNLPLAIRCAEKQGQHCNMPYEDLVQIAYIGLIKAVERYQPDRGFAFSSFAVPYIRGEIQHYLRNNRHLLKIPRQWQEWADSVRKQQQQLLKQGIERSLGDIAEERGISRERWREIEFAVSGKTVSRLSEEQNIEEFPDSVEGNSPLVPVAIAQLSRLPKCDRKLLIEHFFGKLSYRDIAARHGLTAIAVRQKIEGAIAQLRRI